MAKTPKWDSVVRHDFYEKITKVIDEALGDNGILVSDGLAYGVGVDGDGVERVVTVKVIVKGQEFSMEDVLAEVDEREKKEILKAEAKAKKDAKVAKAKKE